MAAGEYDMLADGVTFTEERDKEVDFSDALRDSRPAASRSRR